MKCSKCKFDNPNGMKFCGECGTKLEKICPKCNFSNPPEFKFCGECGHDLRKPQETPPVDEPEAKTSPMRYGNLSRKMLEAIRSIWKKSSIPLSNQGL